MNVEKCKSCGASIYWAAQRPPSTIPIPVDIEPVVNGNMVLRNGVAVYLNGDMFDEEAKIREGESRYVSHFATCPDRDRWRKRKPGQTRD